MFPSIVLPLCHHLLRVLEGTFKVVEKRVLGEGTVCKSRLWESDNGINTNALICMRLFHSQRCLSLIFKQLAFVFELLSTESSLSSLSVGLRRSLSMKFKAHLSAARTYWWPGSNPTRIQRRSCTMCKSDSGIQLKSLV